jgi:hypothetical protein
MKDIEERVIFSQFTRIIPAQFFERIRSDTEMSEEFTSTIIEGFVPDPIFLPCAPLR